MEDGAKEETAILDYPIHQHKLLTLLAAAYAWHFQAAYVLKLNDALEEGACLCICVYMYMWRWMDGWVGGWADGLNNANHPHPHTYSHF